MILLQIRDYLQAHGRASAEDLAVHFNTEPEAIRTMVRKWERKGMVEAIAVNGECGGCTKCEDKLPEVYRWCSGSSISNSYSDT